MWIICQADDSHEMSNLIFSKKIKMSSAAFVIGILRVNFSIPVIDFLIIVTN